MIIRGSLHDLDCQGPSRCTCNSIRIAKPSPRPKKAPSPLRSKPHVIAPRLREEVLERDDWTCRWCLIEGGALDLHHRKARSQGGRDELDNLISAHRLCHAQIHRSPAVARKLGLIVAAGANE